ncbi:hypothetical protein D3C85_1143070 [compost metagenome]
MAHQIDGGKQQIAELIADPLFVHIDHQRLLHHLLDLLVDLVHHGAERLPVETDGGAALLDLDGAGQGRQRERDVIQHALLVERGALLGLLRLPVQLDRLLVTQLRIGEHMGMAADQLLTHRGDDIGEIEQPLLLAQLCVEHHLEQQIAEFALQSFPIPGFDGIGHLVGLLQGVGHYGLEILLEIPGATPLRITQLSHDLEQLGQVVTLGHERVASIRAKGLKQDRPRGPVIIRGAWR